MEGSGGLGLAPDSHPLTLSHSPSRVPSVQLDQAQEDQALLAPWDPSILGPSIRGHQGLPLSEYSQLPGICDMGVYMLARKATGPVSIYHQE